MKKKGTPKTPFERKSGRTAGFLIFLVLTVFAASPLSAQRNPINVNLIIDSSVSLAAIKDDVTSWTCQRLDQILVQGDNVTIWSAGTQARVIYSGTISGTAEKEAAYRSIREISPSGNNPDFSGALREAAGRNGSPYDYTLLISASTAALSSVLTGPNANLLRFSRVEEFTSWRAIVVGLNMDTRVQRAAAAFFR
ncbi:MAG: hypothetical protein FWB83_02375 [Treponema sp.]|nr:hypothetical protein [Treponema sp.]